MISDLIIKKAIITERSLLDAAKGIFTFEVSKESTKDQAKKAINKMFNVNVTAITSSILKGKTKLTGKKRIPVKKADSKKIRVKLKPGEKIDLFETGEKKQ